MNLKWNPIQSHWLEFKISPTELDIKPELECGVNQKLFNAAVPFWLNTKYEWPGCQKVNLEANSGIICKAGGTVHRQRWEKGEGGTLVLMVWPWIQESPQCGAALSKSSADGWVRATLHPPQGLWHWGPGCPSAGSCACPISGALLSTAREEGAAGPFLGALPGHQHSVSPISQV